MKEMKKKANNAYAYISIVAIVAIVAVFVMFAGNNKTQPVFTGDLVGDARHVPTFEDFVHNQPYNPQGPDPRSVPSIEDFVHNQPYNPEGPDPRTILEIINSQIEPITINPLSIKDEKALQTFKEDFLLAQARGDERTAKNLLEKAKNLNGVIILEKEESMNFLMSELGNDLRVTCFCLCGDTAPSCNPCPSGTCYCGYGGSYDTTCGLITWVPGGFWGFGHILISLPKNK